MTATPDLVLIPPKSHGKYWTGGETCDFCHVICTGDLFDAATFSGPWATMCLKCAHQNCHMKMGLGRGQHYKQTTDGRWLKVAG